MLIYFYFFYLIYFTVSVTAAAVAAYEGYFLLINSTGIPAAIYTIFHGTFVGWLNN